MAKGRLFKFFLTLLVAFFVVGLLAVVAGWVLVMRGPTVPDHSTLVLRINGALTEMPPNDVIAQFAGGTRARTVRGFVDMLRRAKSDPRIDSVLLVLRPIDSPFWGKVQEIRDAVLDFRRSGKRVNAYIESGAEREYYLATAADRIFLFPAGGLHVQGLASYIAFLRGTLDKVGVQADIEHIGRYKTAPNQFTERGFTPAHREMTESLNRDMYEQLVRGIAEGRKKSVEQVKALIDEGPFLPEQAMKAGLVDALAYEDQLDDRGAMSKSGKVDGEDYGRGRGGSLNARRPRVAVIYITGAIESGRGSFDPLSGGTSAGSETVVDAIRAARADQSVRAIVLRIDSPGGSAIASDVIWRELVVTRDEKSSRPLVASMSDLAASGGYYVAVAASQIVAQPGTLTGSIGIFGGKYVLNGLYEKLGLTVEPVSIGRNAEIESPLRPYTDSERAKVREQLRAFYDLFLAKVAASRRMPVARVEAVASGRVWTGAQARQNGLVDALGGLDRAIALAKERAGIAADTDVEIVNYPARKSLFELISEQLLGTGNEGGAALAARMLGAGDPGSFSMLTAPIRLFRNGEPLALMPFGFLR